MLLIDSTEPAWDFFSLSAPPLLTYTLSLKINKKNKLTNDIKELISCVFFY